jgi:hypothetical protein
LKVRILVESKNEWGVTVGKTIHIPMKSTHQRKLTPGMVFDVIDINGRHQLTYQLYNFVENFSTVMNDWEIKQLGVIECINYNKVWNELNV